LTLPFSELLGFCFIHLEYLCFLFVFILLRTNSELVKGVGNFIHIYN